MFTQADLDKFRADHAQGIVHLVGKNGAWECVFRAPSRNEYKMYRANVHNPARIADASDTLAIQTVVSHSREAFLALLEKFPGIPEALCASDDLKELTGTAVEEGAKT